MQQDEILRISLVQYNIAWEDKTKNIGYISDTIATLKGKTDIVILPEMCTTAFTMNVQAMAEGTHGNSLTQIKKIAVQNDVAICGSLIVHENNKYYNRAFFISSTQEHYYDKRHLFRMGQEGVYFSSGENKLVIEHKSFNVCLMVCYDLRFPVWSRNVNNEYDLLVYVANWPTSRRAVWNTLLRARAIENMSYVCGVNRIGEDGNGLKHSGDSALINHRGEDIAVLDSNSQAIITATIHKDALIRDREKFPVWKDADTFNINI